ncbi:hypothetical protein ACEPAI_6310 [Sanghuangporus weigelae]
MFFLLLEGLCSCLVAPRGYPFNRRQEIDLPFQTAAGRNSSTLSRLTKQAPSYIQISQTTRSVDPSSIPRTTLFQSLHIDKDSVPSQNQTFRFEDTGSIALPRPSLRPPEPVLDTGITIKEQTLLQRRNRNDERPDPVVITFGILGALVGLIVLILCGRSVLHYHRMPRRDLVAEHIDRYNLERELAEIEDARLGILHSPGEALDAQSPPPYQEAPKYEDAMKTTRVAAGTPRS